MSIENSNKCEGEIAPLVTVAIPTYNRSKSIGQALESVLSQDYPNIEIFVSDNCSDDDTPELIEKYQKYDKIRYTRQPTNIGLLANWNYCLDAARGQYYLILSDDDCLEPDAISTLVEVYINGGSNIAFAYGQCSLVNGYVNKLKVTTGAPLLEDKLSFQSGVLNQTRVSYPSATLFRTKDALDAGGYSNECPGGADLALALSILENYSHVGFSQSITTTYKFHRDNYTSKLDLGVVVENVDKLFEITVRKKSEDFHKLESSAAYGKSIALIQFCAIRVADRSWSLKYAFYQLWKRRDVVKNISTLFVYVKGMVKLTKFRLMRP